ncbi:MAG: methyltransferase [Pseudomonadota bacterium]
MLQRARRALLSRVADSDWQGQAALGWVGRLLARRQAGQLFDLCAGFTYSQTLAACETLNVFEQLREGPLPLDRLALDCGCPPDRLRALLDAAVALRLLDGSSAAYEIGMLGAALLGNPGVRAMVRHHHYLYADLLAPDALVRDPTFRGELQRYWAYADGAADQPAAVADYSRLMADSQSFIATQVLHVLDLGGYRQLVDLGGGHGVFAASALAANPQLAATVFDLPAVVADAAATPWSATPRLSYLGGDLFSGPLPQADVFTLVRILHDHNDDAVLTVLKRVRQALSGGGDLLIIEPLAGAGARRSSVAYFGLYFLAMGQGRLRTRDELIALLRAAGFDQFQSVATPVPQLAEVLKAHVPATGG